MKISCRFRYPVARFSIFIKTHYLILYCGCQIFFPAELGLRRAPDEGSWGEQRSRTVTVDLVREWLSLWALESDKCGDKFCFQLCGLSFLTW
jgi:hypothetical protein